MKYVLGILITFGLAMNGLNAQSSSFYIGGNAGTNFTKFRLTEDLAELYSNTSNVTGINAGFIAGMQLGNFTMSTGLNYMQKGGQFETDNFTDETGTGFYTAKEKLHYLTIPLLVGYRTDLDKDFGVSFSLGPSFNMGLSGKGDEITEYFGSDDKVEEHYTVKFGNSVNDDYRNLQMSFLISPGFFVSLNESSKLTFNLTWERGLNDAFNQRYKQANEFFDTYKGNQYLRSTVFTVGYEFHFPINDKY